MKKVVIVVLMVVVMIFGAFTYANGFFGIPSYSKLKEQKEIYDEKTSELEKAEQQLAENERKLTSVLSTYSSNKEQYENQISYYSLEDQAKASGGDYYDLEYIWTVLGTYGVQEGVELEIVCTTGTSTTESSDFIYANLNFTVVGEYRPVSEFIEDCETDSTLEFTISSFKLEPWEDASAEENTANYVQATFVVQDVPLGLETLELVDDSVEDSSDAQENLISTESN